MRNDEARAAHPLPRRGAHKHFVAALGLLCLFAATPAALARTAAPIDDVAARELPHEARATLERIKAGGPFHSRRDGAPFGNRERRLPLRERGYYLEYTVPTPGAADRAARRIVAGRGRTGDVRTSGEYYYTADHYRSFARIRE